MEHQHQTTASTGAHRIIQVMHLPRHARHSNHLPFYNASIDVVLFQPCRQILPSRRAIRQRKSNDRQPENSDRSKNHFSCEPALDTCYGRFNIINYLLTQFFFHLLSETHQEAILKFSNRSYAQIARIVVFPFVTEPCHPPKKTHKITHTHTHT